MIKGIGNKNKTSVGSNVNLIILIILALGCLLPLLNILAVSLSSAEYVQAGEVLFIPRGFNFSSFKFVFSRQEMWTSLLITLERVVIGVPLNVILCILCAYPLSKATRQFKFRTPYVWFLFITILFSGGLLPWFFLINSLNMMDTIWALVLPGAVPVFSVILMLNYFRQVPVELEEAAEIDGANQWQILFKIYVPVALPAIATISLFSFVFHWNSWFDGKLLSTDPANLPFQSYIQVMLNISSADFYKYVGTADYAGMNLETFKSAQIIVSLIPILLVYPFVQKFFTKGIVMGSVKG